MRDYLISRLHADVEGVCTGQYFIICVIDHEQITLGKIIPGRGDAEFTINYKAIVYRPFRGETVDAVVTTVNKMGFFAEAGALTCFVSKQCIPADMPFDESGTMPQYSDGADQVINRGAHVRLKLVGVRSDVGKMFATGSIKEVSSERRARFVDLWDLCWLTGRILCCRTISGGFFFQRPLLLLESLCCGAY